MHFLARGGSMYPNETGEANPEIATHFQVYRRIDCRYYRPSPGHQQLPLPRQGCAEFSEAMDLVNASTDDECRCMKRRTWYH